ncbi:hypothetical protein PG999_007487 [Apiospora kogelbergensis]|uniref:LPXTG-motif cell wall anchor domain-containing protein n=1 Tax=Apiospora kogelbergensis TaxID=1337665 RepID=A0AAW0QYH5_9PEZI
MAWRPIRWLILALATPLWAADCFITDDWNHMVPGRPMVLAWANFHGSFYDILLNSDVLSRASLSSIVWLPPDDITDGKPDRLFAVQLWDLARGTVCNSPSFSFKARSPDTPSATLPPGPLVSTATSFSSTPVNIIATVAPAFATGVEPSYSSAVPTSTATGAPQPTDEPAKPTNTATIITGAVIGTLLAALLVVSGLLWRARRKRARERGVALPDNDDHDPQPRPSTHDHAAAELGDARHGATKGAAEVQGDDGMRFEMAALADKPLYEMPTSFAPVELPAELPSEVLARHAGVDRCQSMVSALTADSRSSLDRGQVSPATIDPRVNHLAKG